MKHLHLLLQLLLAFGVLLHQALTQSPQGFISLDCGLLESNGYNDSQTGLFYTADDDYVETGKGRNISPEFMGNLPRQLTSVRSFSGPQGSRNCYTFRPLHGKGNKILLRVTFLYGNYDGENTFPQFDVYLGVEYWMTVNITSSDGIQEKEILHIPASDYLHLCLANKGSGTPFISLIELRPFDPSLLIYKTDSGSLELVDRWDLGPTKFENYYRYADDTLDRIWKRGNLRNTSSINMSSTTSLITENDFHVPQGVMRTANQLVGTDSVYTIPVEPDNVANRYYLYLHFAELVENSSREIDTYINGMRWGESKVLEYRNTLTRYSRVGEYINNFSIAHTSNSKLPAMLNAFELYQVKHLLIHSQTHQLEVDAIYSIKSLYGISRNWEGDPCLPQSFKWIGINCSYNVFDPPNITSLNLSSSELVGTISPVISNLTMLQSLDLSNNNLTGEVPYFLSSLPALTQLYLRGNNFTGALPPALLEKSKRGSLTLSSDLFDNTNCANDSCKKDKRNNTTTIIAAVASVAGFIGLIILLSTLYYMFIRRKQPGVFLEPKLKQFSFSEIMNMIGDKRVLGEGGFGNVYQGCMKGVQVAVKVLKVSPEEQTNDFISEVKILATVHHTNLTRIIGYCNEGLNRAILFELMENGNLMTKLLGSNSNVLSWEKRLFILNGAAQGLEYLHHGCNPPIIHRDIKPENILLSTDFVPKIADFGLSRIFPIKTARIMGTVGYLDPEYVEPNMLTEKVDVYSFGVMMLVVMTGQAPIVEKTHITQRIAPWISNGDIRGIFDRRLQHEYDVNVAWRVLELALECVSRNVSKRPNMHSVVRELSECLTTTTTTIATPKHGEDTALFSQYVGSVFSPATR